MIIRFLFRVFTLLLLLTWSGVVYTTPFVYATPLSPETSTEIPPQLQAWVPWITHRLDEAPCVKTTVGEVCSWPAHLQLSLSESGGEFSLTVTMQKAGKITLPGDENAWPQKVTVKSLGESTSERELAIALQSGTPVAFLPSGRFRIKGIFEWDSAPGVIKVPTEIAIVNLSISGKEIRTFERPANGTISLRELLSSQPKAPESEVSTSVFRLIEDGIPFKVTTRIVLSVGSEQLQLSIPDPSPSGTALSGIESATPYFISNTGELTFALQSGTHVIELLSISPSPLIHLQAVNQSPIWPSEEVWAWKDDRELRVTSLSGGVPIDPNLTGVPSEWAQYPTFSLPSGSPIAIEEKQGIGSKKKLGAVTVQRRFTQDISGTGFTIEDRVVGTLGGSGRLNMSPPTELGAAEMQSVPHLITTDDGVGLRGIEVREEQFVATSRSRLAGVKSEIPVVGWDRDIDWLQVTLQLPSWDEVLWVHGADSTVGTRISAWNLGSVFLLTLVAILACKVLGILGGAASLLCFTLLHGEGTNLLDLFVLLLIGIPFLKRERNSTAAGLAYMAVLLWMVISAYLFVSNDIMTRIHPDYHQSVLRTVSSHSETLPPSSNRHLGSSSVTKYNDTRIESTTNAVITYAEGSFGALIMLVCGGIALLCLALRKFKSAALAAVAFVGAFTLRSMLSTFFDDSSIPQYSRQSQYENYSTIANNLGIKPDLYKLQNFDSSIPQDRVATIQGEDSETGDVTSQVTRKSSPQTAYSPSSLVTQSGPGIPQWEGREVVLSWEGAVPKGHTVSLVTLSFGWGLFLAGVRGALLLTLILLVWRAAPPQIAQLLNSIRRENNSTNVASKAISLSALLLLFLKLTTLAPAMAQEGFPPDQLLNELQERLKATRDKQTLCTSDCISTERMHLNLADEILEGSVLVHSIGKNPWFLPSLPQRSSLSSITLNGAPVSAAFRDDRGTLLLLEDGVHRVVFTIPVVPHTPVTLTLLQLAGRLTTKAEGYRAFTEQTSNGTIVQFLPNEGPKEQPIGRRADLSPWYSVTRRIVVGSDIRTELVVNRIGDYTKDGALELALLEGERILDSGVKRRDGGIVVTMKAGTQETIHYAGLIPNQPSTILLEATSGAKYSEDWVVQCAPQWHCTFEGLQPTEKFESSQAYFHFTPRPGEKTSFSLKKLGSAPGATQTVLQAGTLYEPSSHFLRSSLSLTIRSGQAATQKISIPEAAQVKEIKIGNQDVLDITNTTARPLEIAVLKGTHTYKVVWQEPSELELAPSITPVDLHGEFTNGSSTLKIPAGWIPVFARSGQLGPYFGVVSFTFVELLLLVALTALLPLPIRLWQAIVILLGAILLGSPAAHLTCGWMFLCGVLQRLHQLEHPLTTSVLMNKWFKIARGCIVILPVVLLAIITLGIFNSSPDLQILGEGSGKEQLVWYADRGVGTLPSPSLLMIPNLAWQIMLLIWGIVVALLTFKILVATLGRKVD